MIAAMPKVSFTKISMQNQLKIVKISLSLSQLDSITTKTTKIVGPEEDRQDV